MSKPKYNIPSMREIEETTANGYEAISTFSGCGGSSLGYKMAGFEILWANEFIPAAQEVYKLNYPNTILNVEDIRNITPEDILITINREKGQIDLLDGSPPCASFSTSGKRNKHWGDIKKYSDTKQRTDDLFFEFARILKGIQPKVFVAENVSGLIRGVAKGYFLEILNCLKKCGYNVKAKLLDASYLGVPQARQRLIFIGVRNDLNIEPVFPKPLPYRYTLREILPYIDRIKLGGRPDNWADSDRPASTIVQSDGARESLTGYLSSYLVEVDISKYAIGDEWDKLSPGEASDKYFNLYKPSLDKPSPTITQTGGNIGAASVVHLTQKRKFTIEELKKICAFPDDFILTGTFAQQWERLGRAVPPIMMYHIAKTIQTGVLDKIRD